MKKILLLVFALYAGASQAQTAEDSVKAVITKMFIAMKSADGKMMGECFADSAIVQTISTNMQGLTYVGKTERPADFLKQIAKIPKDSADERITFEIVKANGPLAIAWTPYRFYYAGKFHHCGVNSFQLVRSAGIWKIQYLIDTRNRTGCD